MDLSLLRQKIDSLDATLVNLLNERARVSLDVGALKKAAEAEKAVVSGRCVELMSVNFQTRPSHFAFSSNSDAKDQSESHVYIPTREKQIYEKVSGFVHKELSTPYPYRRRSLLARHIVSHPSGSFSSNASTRVL